MDIVTKFQVSILKNDKVRGGGEETSPLTWNKLDQRQRGIGLKKFHSLLLNIWCESFVPIRIAIKNGRKIIKRFMTVIKTLKTWCLTICFFPAFHKLKRGGIVYYKSLSDSNWYENDYNWACFYSNKILCVGWEGNKILFWITNMTNYYLFYVIIAI